MMLETNKTEEAFQSLLANLPQKWLSPKMAYKRWVKGGRRRYGYYSWNKPTTINVSEDQLRLILDSLRTSTNSKSAQSSINKLIETVQNSYTNELVRVLNLALSDKIKKREYLASVAEQKRIKTEKKAADKILAEKKKAATKIAVEKQKAKLAEERQQATAKRREKKRLLNQKKREKAKKNKNLIASLYLTEAQKAILKKIAG